MASIASRRLNKELKEIYAEGLPIGAILVSCLLVKGLFPMRGLALHPCRYPTRQRGRAEQVAALRRGQGRVCVRGQQNLMGVDLRRKNKSHNTRLPFLFASFEIRAKSSL